MQAGAGRATLLWLLAATTWLAGCGVEATGSHDGAPGGDDPDAARTDGGSTPGSDGTPPAGSSGGSGGTPTDGAYESRTASNGVPYSLHTPVGYDPAQPVPLLIGLSGTEGRAVYTQVFSVIYPEEAAAYVVVVIGGPDVGQEEPASGARVGVVMNEIKSLFNIDLARQYMNTVSYGTIAGLDLGFDLEQDEFAAIWFTAPNAGNAPVRSASALGFAPGVGTAYGVSSSNGTVAAAIREGAAAQGYSPVIDFPRPGGHSPEVPSAEWDRMWQLFREKQR